MTQIFGVKDPAYFDEQPEFAMGIHIAVESDRRRHRESDAFIVFNSVIALRVGDVLEASETIVPGEGYSEQNRQRMTDQTLIELELCENIDLLVRIVGLPEWSRHRFRQHGRVHGSPPFHAKSRAGQEFVRLSGFHHDRRVTADGGLTKGTFATSKLDAQMVPTALSAVGHYALPSILPPVYCFRIVPPPLTDLYYGTVAAAFAQSGGGTLSSSTVCKWERFRVH